MLKIPEFTKKDLDYIKEYGNLTPREKDVLELRNDEYPPTIEQIAEMWGCSPSTVSKVIKSLKKKMFKLLILQ